MTTHDALPADAAGRPAGSTDTDTAAVPDAAISTDTNAAGDEILDCLIIGAGPAGLTAATYLVRYHRRIR